MDAVNCFMCSMQQWDDDDYYYCNYHYDCPGYFVLKCVASSHLKCCGDESLPVYQLIGV